MTYRIQKFNSPYNILTIGYADTLQEAKNMIPKGILQILEDFQFPNHFDVFSETGEIFTIEPNGD